MCLEAPVQISARSNDERTGIEERIQTALLPPPLSFSRFSPLFLLSFNSVLPLSRLPSTVADTFKLKRQLAASLLD